MSKENKYLLPLRDPKPKPGQTWERQDGVVGTVVRWRDGRLAFEYRPKWRHRTYYLLTPAGRAVGGVSVPPLRRRIKPRLCWVARVLKG